MSETIRPDVLPLVPEHPRAASGDSLPADHRTVIPSARVDNTRSCPGAILVWICGKTLSIIIIVYACYDSMHWKFLILNNLNVRATETVVCTSV